MKLLALKLFSTATDAAGNVTESISAYSDIALAILSKFIDVLEGALVIFCTFIVVRFVRKYFARIETTHEQQRTALNLLEKITSGFIVVVGITLGLKIIGLDLTLLISVLTLGLSFGLRDIIKNYVAGILILFKSPFAIGDVIKIKNFTGRVEKIEFQAITIKTFDNKDITVYNKDVLTQPLTNFSRNAERRLELDFRLGYGSDLQAALKIIETIMEEHPRILKTPKKSVMFRSFENNGTAFRVRFWVNRPCNALKIQTDLALKIQEALDEENLFAPFMREAGLEAARGMSAGRAQRLKAFYAAPAMMEILNKIGQQVAQASPSAITGETATAVATLPAEEEYADAEEPE